MKPINPLRAELKKAGIFKKPSKVESSLIKREPVNTQARLAIAPRPWWSDPPPDNTPRVNWEGECKRLTAALKAERQERGQAEERLHRNRTSLENKLSEATAMIIRLEAERQRLASENEILHAELNAITSLVAPR